MAISRVIKKSETFNSEYLDYDIHFRVQVSSNPTKITFYNGSDETEFDPAKYLKMCEFFKETGHLVDLISKGKSPRIRTEKTVEESTSIV